MNKKVTYKLKYPIDGITELVISNKRTQAELNIYKRVGVEGLQMNTTAEILAERTNQPLDIIGKIKMVDFKGIAELLKTQIGANNEQSK